MKKELFDAVCKKVAPLDELTLHEIKEILKKMLEAKEQLCIVFIEVFTDYIQSNLPNKHGLHPLQTKLLQRMLDQLNAQG